MIFLNQNLSEQQIAKKNAFYVKLANDIYSYLDKSRSGDANAVITSASMCDQAREVLDDLYRYDLLDESLYVVQSNQGWLTFSWYLDENHEITVDMIDSKTREYDLEYMFDFPEWRSVHKRWIGEVSEIAEIEKVIRMFLGIVHKENASASSSSKVQDKECNKVYCQFV